MKVLISEIQYVTLMEDIKKEQYKELVLNLLEMLFGKLSIKYAKDDEDTFHAVYDQDGVEIADIYLGKFGNTGCKKDLTLSRDVTEILEGYVPYFRHKIFSKVFIDYIHDKLGIKCDCIHYEYKFETKRELDSDGIEFDWTKSKTRMYNVKKKKKIKESVDKRKKLFIDLLGEDLINSIRKITSAKELPIEFLKSLGTSRIQQYIDMYGPLYYFVFEGEPFIYKDRVSPKGEEYEMFINSKGESFFNGQITNRLGLDYTGLKFSEVIDMFSNEEKDNTPLNESVDKNKKFLIDVMGIDFTGKIEEIKDPYDVPLEFDKTIRPDLIRSLLSYFGPMYLVDIDGKKYLYQYRTDEDDRFDVGGDFEWFRDENGFNYVDGEIPEKLGITQMGLKFSDIIDMFFNEEDNI